MPSAKSHPALALVQPRLDLDLALRHEVHRMRRLAAANDDFVTVHPPSPQQLRDVSNIPGGEVSEQWNPGHHTPRSFRDWLIDLRQCMCVFLLHTLTKASTLMPLAIQNR